MAGEDRGIDQHVAADLAHALFLQDGHHIAQALALEGRIAAEAGDQVAAQHAIADIALALQRGGETVIGPELQQCRQRRQHFLGTGRQRHLLRVIIDRRRAGTDFLNDQGKVGPIRQILCVLFNRGRIRIQNKCASQCTDNS